MGEGPLSTRCMSSSDIPSGENGFNGPRRSDSTASAWRSGNGRLGQVDAGNRIASVSWLANHDSITASAFEYGSAGTSVAIKGINQHFGTSGSWVAEAVIVDGGKIGSVVAHTIGSTCTARRTSSASTGTANVQKWRVGRYRRKLAAARRLQRQGGGRHLLPSRTKVTRAPASLTLGFRHPYRSKPTPSSRTGVNINCTFTISPPVTKRSCPTASAL